MGVWTPPPPLTFPSGSPVVLYIDASALFNAENSAKCLRGAMASEQSERLS